MAMNDGAGARRIFVGAVLADSLRVVCDLRFVARAAAVPFLFDLVGDVLHRLYANAAISLPALALVAIAGASLAVKTHRHILLHEPPGAANLGARDWRYLGRYIVIALPLLAIFLAILLAAALATATVPIDIPLWVLVGGAVVLLGILFFALFVLLVMPAALSLPALAIGNETFGAADSRTALTGNRSALFAIAAAVILVPLSLAIGLAFGLNAIDQTGIAVVEPVNALLQCFSEVGFSASLSFVYAGIVQGDRRYAG